MDIVYSNRSIVGNTLVECAFFDYNKPVVICFNPAGKLLSEKQLHSGAHAWGFKFISSLGINVVAINTLSLNHWFLCSEFEEYVPKLAVLLKRFPERLGYGASMGAFAVTYYAGQLNINRALLYSPLQPPKRDHNFDFTECHSTHWSIIYDPFNEEDKAIAHLYPAQSHYLHFYGVGHQVIESIAKIKYLKPLFLQFYAGQIADVEFYKQQTKKRTLIRYYSYMDRNPTKKNTFKRKAIIKKNKLLFILRNSDLLYKQVANRISKSIQKRINKIIEERSL
ncbi:hypothetical protein [Vibrio toranzoniae]|uniref:hypothetical protein n=1 Tax=Vibrio toranzoniae TaxID=1194427 RepID=UPI001378F5A2|nr:hypothetical protein [Vibrio toranzoniae]NAZ71294.1 hypothetical protein [Vibrio toranzoniae]